MSDQGAGNRNGGGNGQGRRGKPWFRPRGGDQGQGGQRDRRQARPQRPSEREDAGFETVVRTPPPQCPVCGKPVTDILCALTERESSLPAHFDCILASLSAAEKLMPQERLVYLGSGSFAVVEADPRNPQRFQIKRKLQYEPREGRPDWRKGLDRVVIRQG
jgi:hypothetical protein